MTTVAEKLVVAIAVLTMGSVRARPQTLRVSGELSALDTRWDTDHEGVLLENIADTFRHSEEMQRAVVDVLRGLREAELGLLERLLGPRVEDMPQADMPLEDLVDDGPQELDEEFQGGDLVVLDSVNSTSPTPPHNSTGEALFPQLHKISRENASDMEERLKEMRLETIKNQIMNILWPSGAPPVMRLNVSSPAVPSSGPGQRDLLRAIADKINAHSHTPTDLYTEKTQSFYPSCEIPRNTDEELWNNSQTMNLLFDLSYPRPQHGTQVKVVAAKLHLYKISQGNGTKNGETCPPGEAEPTFSEDKMIRVSVYWYTRSLKKHRVKRKLLDSQMLSVYGDLWTEWNIKGAVNYWRDNGRNFGLAVEVEDEDGTVLHTNKFFAPMNCSEEASTSRPIPGFLVARALTPDNNNTASSEQTIHIGTFLFPMIDLCTIEFPESEKPENGFYRRVPSKRPRGQPQVSSNDTEHRIRHASHKVTEVTNKPPHRHTETIRRDDGDSLEEITWGDDLDGHQIRKQIIVQKSVPISHNDEQGNDR